MQNIAAYLRFLVAIEEKRQENPGKNLDSFEILLLEQVLVRAEKDQYLTIGELIGLKTIGSQATLHSRLKNLICARYIKLFADKRDGRRKFVAPSTLGLQYAEFMSSCLAV